MPSLLPSFAIDIYTSASQLPKLVWDAFRAHPCDSNIMFPHAEKLLHAEHEGYPTNGIWITCTTLRDSTSIDFILSCTDGPIGKYPIFIFTPLPLDELDCHYMESRIISLAHALQTMVPIERVFSVFAPDLIARTFAEIWSEVTGVSLDPKPEYYAAKISYCTRDSFRPQQASAIAGLEYNLRLADVGDVERVAELCYGFAAESEPFTLDHEGALIEAFRLIEKRQLWVHDILVDSECVGIASIVAVTRTSDTVSAITKVYTNPRWRKQGCAERLTRWVCKHLLTTKEKVVLYIAHNNPQATKVYDKVGFLGLNEKSGKIVGVDNWLELGFDRQLVQLGHW